MTEAPAENPRVHQSPDEAALCWSTDLGHLPEDDEQEEHDPDPPQDQPAVQEVKQGAAADDQEAGGQEQKEVGGESQEMLCEDSWTEASVKTRFRF